MNREAERTGDGGYAVVDGRRRRSGDPGLPDDARTGPRGAALRDLER